jgi:3-deoxy-D-manno-octulosonic-acid transferase
MDRYAVFSSFFFRAYSVLWRLARPFLRRGGRLADGWKEREVPPGWCEPVDIWIHAASGGEARLAISLLEQFSPRPGLRALLTAWTRQGRDMLERGAASLEETRPWLRTFVRFAPLDEPSVVRRAMEQAGPRLLVLLETEIWPGLLGACAERGVPAHIVNARMTRVSYELYRLLPPGLLNLPLAGIHAVSREDALRFSRLFGEKGAAAGAVSVLPNVKFGQAAAAAAAPPDQGLLPLFRGASPVFLFASVRQQEETRLAPLFPRLLRDFPGAVLVVAPRHIHRVKPWLERLADMGLNPLPSSALGEDRAAVPGGSVIWDRFGDLPRLYAVADAVFVGGSLKGGGQNFLEAPAAGVVPCVGPSLDNFRWALGEDQPPSLADAGLLTVCPSVRSLREKLAAAAASPPDRGQIRRLFQAWLSPRAGGAAGIVRLLDDFLPK